MFRDYILIIVTILFYSILIGIGYGYYTTSSLVVLDQQRVELKRGGSGAWGSPTRTWEITDHRHDQIYQRKYKKFGLSNLLVGFKELQRPDSIYLYVAESDFFQVGSTTYVGVSAQPMNSVRRILDIVGYMTANWFLWFGLVFFGTVLLSGSGKNKGERSEGRTSRGPVFRYFIKAVLLLHLSIFLLMLCY